MKFKYVIQRSQDYGMLWTDSISSDDIVRMCNLKDDWVKQNTSLAVRFRIVMILS